MTLRIPVTNKECNISIWQKKRYWNNFSVVNGDPPISSWSSLEIQGREVKETPYLIFHLKLISPIPTSRNRTISPQYTILPRVFPVLYSIPALKYYPVLLTLTFLILKTCLECKWYMEIIPCKKQCLIEVILDIDNNIPVCSDVKNWSWKLPVYPNHLEKWSSQFHLSLASNLEDYRVKLLDYKLGIGTNSKV